MRLTFGKVAGDALLRSRHLRPTWKPNNRHSSMCFLCCSNVTLSHRPLLVAYQILELPSLLAMQVPYAHSESGHMRWLLPTSLTKPCARHNEKAPLSYRHMVYIVLTVIQKKSLVPLNALYNVFYKRVHITSE